MGLPEFSPYAPARLVRARTVAAEQARLTIEPPADFPAAHLRAGQFCMMETGDDDGIFAMASAPGETPVTFLVRTAEDAACAAHIASLEDGAEVRMTGPAGPGFALERAEGRDVYLVATGTGVAPVCAAIEVLLADRTRYGRLRLIHGVKSDAHVAIADRVERWARASLETHVCLSTFEDGVLKGQSVQAALHDERPDLSEAALVAVGQSAMLDSLWETARELGLVEARFLTNL